jgi:hypothetical protein
VTLPANRPHGLEIEVIDEFTGIGNFAREIQAGSNRANPEDSRLEISLSDTSRPDHTLPAHGICRERAAPAARGRKPANRYCVSITKVRSSIRHPAVAPDAPAPSAVTLTVETPARGIRM